MSDSASWYARRLARQPSPGPRPSAFPVRSQQQPTTPYPPGGNVYVQPQQMPQEKVTIENLWGAMQHWRGGKAHKIDPYPCPECGSPNFSSRTDGTMRGPAPAPHCFNCGYNGMFTQGLATTWQGG